MSRIHEALAKAVRERAPQKTSRASGDLVDIAVNIDIPMVESVVPEKPAELESRHPNFEQVARDCAKVEWRLDTRASVFLSTSKEKVGAERFRTLRSRLYQIADKRPLRRVMVTSSLPSEGKSFVCANLAQCIVQQHNRSVLVIDSDLRMPNQHKIFNAPMTPGLTNYLRGDVEECAVIQKGNIPNLFLIPSGDELTNPSELLLGDRMKRLMRFSAETFDWVILDSPPTVPVHDPSMLADQCDGVLFVVKAGSTDFEIAAKAISEFRQKNLLGVVFNHAEKGESYGGYYG